MLSLKRGGLREEQWLYYHLVGWWDWFEWILVHITSWSYVWVSSWSFTWWLMSHSRPQFPDSVHPMHITSSMFLGFQKHMSVRVINHPIMLMILMINGPGFQPLNLLVYDPKMIHCLQLRIAFLWSLHYLNLWDRSPGTLSRDCRCVNHSHLYCHANS